MTTLGEDLKRERELRAVPLQEIANTTKISVRFFEALEADRWDGLPGPFFIKGIIRSYCRTIGADEDYFLNKYHHEVLLQKAAETAEIRRFLGRTKTLSAARRLRPNRRTVLAALAVLAVAAVVLFLVFRPRRPVLPAVPTPASFVAPRLAAPAVPENLTPAAGVSEALLRVELEFRAETWMLASADGRVVLEGIQMAGETVRLEAKDVIILNTGNAGGVEMKINGRPALPLGAPGAVRTDIKITRDNVSSYLRDSAPAADAGR